MRSPLLLLLALAALLHAGDDGPELARIEALVVDVQKGEPEARRAACEALAKLGPDQIPALIEALGGVRVRFGTIIPGGNLSISMGSRESITGKWTGEKGERGDYRLDSRGDGRYRLRARARDAEGNSRKIEDEGTMAELGRKYPFLQKGTMVRMSAGAFPSFILGAAPRAKPGTTIERLGVVVRTPSAELSYHLALPEGSGLVVREVKSGSLAERLGLRPFDVVVRMGETLIDDPAQLADLGRAATTLRIHRRAKAETLEIKPAR